MTDHIEPVVLFPKPKPLSKARFNTLLAKARAIVKKVETEEQQKSDR